MRTPHKAAALATVFLAAGLVAAPAQAKTQHCDPGLDKYEVDAGPSIDTDLPDGTPVCIKAGTKTYYTTVEGGTITNDSIKNKPGNAYLGISYYVVYHDECVDDPYTPEDECDEGSGGS